MKETAVLLATYNGATFLTEQLNSLLGQSYPDFLIIAQDDGSRDETPKLLAHFAQRPAARCLVLTDDSAGVGACRNFGRLLDIALAHSERFKYFAFCDQDDWWAPDKLRLMTAQLRDFEQTYPEIPLLAHCDLEVVDSSLQVMAPSYWTNQRVNPAERRISSLLLRNTTVGCAMVINRRLAEVVLPFPPEAIMHDWWITLVAAITGGIQVVSKPLVKYRQHSGNALGAKNPGLQRFLSIGHWKNRVLNNTEFAAARPYEQADALRRRFFATLRPEDVRRLQHFAGIRDLGVLQKRAQVLRSGIFPRDPIRLVGTLLKL